MAKTPRTTDHDPKERSDGNFIARFYKKGDVDMIELRKVPEVQVPPKGDVFLTVRANAEWKDPEVPARERRFDEPTVTYGERVAAWPPYPKLPRTSPAPVAKSATAPADKPVSTPSSSHSLPPAVPGSSAFAPKSAGSNPHSKTFK